MTQCMMTVPMRFRDYRHIEKVLALGSAKRIYTRVARRHGHCHTILPDTMIYSMATTQFIYDVERLISTSEYPEQLVSVYRLTDTLREEGPSDKWMAFAEHVLMDEKLPRFRQWSPALEKIVALLKVFIDLQKRLVSTEYIDGAYEPCLPELPQQQS